MKYVALLSGGKDSCFNLLHCAKNGHELVAAASLGPPEGKEEIDSYLYQTVGQDAIGYIAQALEVPLYRKVIRGLALEQKMEYGGRHPESSKGTIGDETEDLYELLSTVKSRHPDIQGVSVGAILSNYQRIRVEHACLRLDLIPLSYLWQRDQRELLSEMIQAGMESVLIKIAGVGLSMKHLGMSISEMQVTLERLNELYGSHICGEGGEYETFTLDCPMFKRRIVLTKTEPYIHSDNDFAPVAYLRIKEAMLVEKPSHDIVDIVAPPLLTEDFQSLIPPPSDIVGSSENKGKLPEKLLECSENYHPKRCCCRQAQWCAVSNIQYEGSVTLEEEVLACFNILEDALMEQNMTRTDIAIITVLLSTMDDFPRVNSIYKTFFGSCPPARATIAVDLPPAVRVRLDCLAYHCKPPEERLALHVQGLSYWAPANIGPYSQAVSIDDHLFISGQIGMFPRDLSLPAAPSCALETVLSLQHISRISDAFVENWSGRSELKLQLVLCWLTDMIDLPTVRQIYSKVAWMKSVPTVFIGVKSLPKGARIESQIVSNSCQNITKDQDGCDVVIHENPLFHQERIEIDGQDVIWEIAQLPSKGIFHAILFVSEGLGGSLIAQLRSTTSIAEALDKLLFVRLIHKVNKGEEATSLTTALLSGATPSISHVPARFICDRDGCDRDFALCLTGGISSNA